MKGGWVGMVGGGRGLRGGGLGKSLGPGVGIGLGVVVRTTYKIFWKNKIIYLYKITIIKDRLFVKNIYVSIF